MQNYENLKKERTTQSINEDTKISDLMEFPEFMYWPRKRNRLSTRIYVMLKHVKEDDDIKANTLSDFRKYIKKYGWKKKPYSSYTRFPNFGNKSIEYFNSTLIKYGLDPLEPLAK